MDIKGKKVIIVGGSSGIGLATAKAALDAGALVIVTSRSKEKLDTLQKELGKNATVIRVDVRDENSVKLMLEKAGAFDHLLISVSGGALGEFGEKPLEEVRPFMEVQFFGYYTVAQHAAKYISRNGSMIFISGTHGRKPSNAATIVTITKSSVDTLAKSLAVKLAPVRVNVIAPGPIDTPLWEKIAGDKIKKKEMIARAAKRLLLGRVGQPEEIAHAALFLMTNDFVTGTVLDIDGGDLLT